MNRKQQLEALISVNEQSISKAQVRIENFKDELRQILNKEKRPVDYNLQTLRRQTLVDPSIDNFVKLTSYSLRCDDGVFVVWRGGQGAPPESGFLEIEQPIFNNHTDGEVPSIRQHFRAVAIQGLDDLKRFLPLCPTGIATLPCGEFLPFRSGEAESLNLLRQKLASDELESLDGDSVNQVAWYQPLYDTCTIRNNITAYNFFTTPVGGVPQFEVWPKTLVETNMLMGGSLPYPRNFWLSGISVVPTSQATYDDVIALFENSFCRLIVGTRDIVLLPTKMLAITPAPVNPTVSFKFSDPLNPVFIFPEIIEILPLQNLRFELQIPVPQQFSKDFRVTTLLHGYTKLCHEKA